MAAFGEALGAFLSRVPDTVPVSGVATPLSPPLSPVQTTFPIAEAKEFLDLREDEPLTSARPRKPKMGAPKWLNWWVLIGAGATLLAVVAGVILTVRTNLGEVLIELNDSLAKVELTLDGERIELTGLDRPLKLKAGEHGLTLSSAEFETVTQSFTVKRGEKQVVKVTLTPKPAGSSKQASAISLFDGWVSLFNGKDLTGWMRPNGAFPGPCWDVRDGAIECLAGNYPADNVHDLWTQDRFGDFVLEMEYRTDGNSGVFIHKSLTEDGSGDGIEVQIDKPVLRGTNTMR